MPEVEVLGVLKQTQTKFEANQGWVNVIERLESGEVLSIEDIRAAITVGDPQAIVPDIQRGKLTTLLGASVGCAIYGLTGARGDEGSTVGILFWKESKRSPDMDIKMQQAIARSSGKGVGAGRGRGINARAVDTFRSIVKPGDKS